MFIDEIVKKAKKKNLKAQTQLYDEFGSLWYSICLRYNKNIDDAQDVLQNALINIFTKIDQFDTRKGNFKSWSSKIVINENLLFLRKMKSSFVDELDNNDIYVDNGLNAIDMLSAKELTMMIQSLPDGYRTVFNMYVLEGFSHQEIAEELNISISTSKSQLFKAKKYLKNKLEVLI